MVPSSSADITPLPIQSPPRVHSPLELEDGFYQPIPTRRWYDAFLDHLNPMPLKQRSHQYPHHRFTPGRSSSPTASITKQEFVVTETPVLEPGPLPSKRRQAFVIFKLGCLVIPVIVLCLL